MTTERNVQTFNRDVETNQGYLYSGTDTLSGTLANRRISDAILAAADFRGKRVLDIGCGDGTYTVEFADAGAREVVGVDAAEEAVRCAQEKATGRANVRFDVVDVYDLAALHGDYDIAVVRGVLHHLYDVQRAIDQIAKTADLLLVLEPNGNNPVLKILERVSTYHVEHEEQSYLPRNLDRWFEERGGRVANSEFLGLVPYFCPDLAARFLKAIEPLVEATPIVRAICCGQYLQRIETQRR